MFGLDTVRIERLKVVVWEDFILKEATKELKILVFGASTSVAAPNWFQSTSSWTTVTISIP